ncbi:nuclear transport factor 2 family protein [Stenotrophomonas sp.]|uniref:nuclear transport factor 2 family protein n=1 Tax=unclassified Stenotrophomonas TaxID=196198 RepID=UPI0028AC4E4D|nr:nuclear transport factor 2 family protein [Stenotrophomonas sp.]
MRALDPTGIRQPAGVTPHAAQVKLTLDYPGWDGEDYLALLNIDGKWMIVSKSWSGQRKSPAS